MGKQYTVSEITELIKTALEGNFGEITVEGEVSNYRPSSAGHLYFSLKDAFAVISCVMFRGKAVSHKTVIKEGALVRVRGRLSVYPPRGGYQIVCEDIEAAGEGNILLMLEKRKRAFAEEGLFDESRKRPLPRFPGTVAVVTAKTGAVIHDIITTLGRRSPGVRIVVLPATVQGEGAAKTIASRIRQANAWRLGDVLIVGRGGGSVEDLLPFSEEIVVRAVAESRIPIVSAVGHDTDWALCDYAADLRAPTPTAAAELVSENWLDMIGSLRSFRENLVDMIYAKLDRIKLFAKPFSREELEFRFRLMVQPRTQRLDDAKDALAQNIQARVAEIRHRAELAKTALESASPLAIMERGYALVTVKATGNILRDAAAIETGETIAVRLLRGGLEAQVLERIPPQMASG
ncbi:MAG: exodeoxyribonuclease VII large subunit [Spirochaetaceae bacterium]|jgi:exodeoxyribonuclease VII large subunit|nr:exodeoxyribonuclease VII large subunit [Spirochaetaceae bacterium]